MRRVVGARCRLQRDQYQS